MKSAAVKKISAVLITFIMIFALQLNAFAETIQENLEKRLEEIAEQFENADSDTQASLQESFNALLQEYGLDEMDLSSLGETDIGQIVSSIGDNLALEEFAGLAEDAFSSGFAMIQDVINSGLGTSDGSNTATTNEATTGGSPNVITPATSQVQVTVAVGVPETVTNPVTSSSAVTTYNTGNTTESNIVGAGVTTAAPVDLNIENSGMDMSSVAVLVVLSVATVAVIVAIVIFFVFKRK